MAKAKKPVKALQIAKLLESTKTGVLVFKLPEEKQDFEDCIKGFKYKQVLRELDEYLRNQIKHHTLSDQAYKTTFQIRKKLNEILNEEEIDIYT